MTPKEILVEAKRLLEEKGWCQGVFQDEGSRYCSVEAVCQAMTLPDHETSADEGLIILASVIGNTAIDEWNDDPSRTKEEVLTAFDKAIKLAEQGENNAPSQA